MRLIFETSMVTANTPFSSKDGKVQFSSLMVGVFNMTQVSFVPSEEGIVMTSMDLEGTLCRGLTTNVNRKDQLEYH
jgi:hypothetical protein